MRLGLALIAPIVSFGVHRDRQRRWHLDKNGAVGAAIFEHEHARAAVLGQPVGEHATRGTRADDDVIESLAIHSRGRWLAPKRKSIISPKERPPRHEPISGRARRRSHFSRRTPFA